MSTIGCDTVRKAYFRHAAQHLGGANIAFADGHVKWMKGEGDADFPDYASSQIYNQCTSTNHGWPTFRVEADDTNDGGHL